MRGSRQGSGFLLGVAALAGTVLMLQVGLTRFYAATWARRPAPP